jgi:hypothetical protein
MKIVVFSALNVTNVRSTWRNCGLQLTFILSFIPKNLRRDCGKQHGCSNQLIAVMVLAAGDGIRLYPLNSRKLADYLE